MPNPILTLTRILAEFASLPCREVAFVPWKCCLNCRAPPLIQNKQGESPPPRLFVPPLARLNLARAHHSQDVGGGTRLLGFCEEGVRLPPHSSRNLRLPRMAPSTQSDLRGFSICPLNRKSNLSAPFLFSDILTVLFIDPNHEI